MAYAGGRDDSQVKDSETRSVKDTETRGGPGLFGSGGGLHGGCNATITFSAPVSLDVGQLAARMLSGGASGGGPQQSAALADVASEALKESRHMKEVHDYEKKLAAAYMAYAESQKKEAPQTQAQPAQAKQPSQNRSGKTKK